MNLQDHHLRTVCMLQRLKRFDINKDKFADTDELFEFLRDVMTKGSLQHKVRRCCPTRTHVFPRSTLVHLPAELTVCCRCVTWATDCRWRHGRQGPDTAVRAHPPLPHAPRHRQRAASLRTVLLLGPRATPAVAVCRRAAREDVRGLRAVRCAVPVGPCHAPVARVSANVHRDDHTVRLTSVQRRRSGWSVRQERRRQLWIPGAPAHHTAYACRDARRTLQVQAKELTHRRPLALPFPGTLLKNKQGLPQEAQAFEELPWVQLLLSADDSVRKLDVPFDAHQAPLAQLQNMFRLMRCVGCSSAPASVVDVSTPVAPLTKRMAWWDCVCWCCHRIVYRHFHASIRDTHTESEILEARRSMFPITTLQQWSGSFQLHGPAHAATAHWVLAGAQIGEVLGEDLTPSREAMKRCAAHVEGVGAAGWGVVALLHADPLQRVRHTTLCARVRAVAGLRSRTSA